METIREQASDENINHAVMYTPTWRERLGYKLFPGKYCHLPDLEDGSGGKDCLVVTTWIEFDFIDRLRVLITGRVSVETRTTTANVIGENKTNHAVYVKGPKFLTER